MSIWDDIFGSERQRKGQELYGKDLNTWDEVYHDVQDSRSAFDDVNDLGSLGKKFGVKPFDIENYKRQVSSTYAPGKQRLASSLRRNRSAMASRLGDRSATPEQSFAPIENQYGSALSNIEGQQAQDVLGGYDKERSQNMDLARLLESILGQKQGFYERRRDRLGNVLSGKSRATSDFLGTQSDSSAFDDILALADTVVNFVKPGGTGGGK